MKKGQSLIALGKTRAHAHEKQSVPSYFTPSKIRKPNAIPREPDLIPQEVHLSPDVNPHVQVDLPKILGDGGRWSLEWLQILW